MSSVTFNAQYMTPPQVAAGTPAEKRLSPAGHGAIACLGVLLALVTASECHSIFYLPSLLYGVCLWGWWSVVASSLWIIGERRPAVSSFSARAIAMHLVAGSALGVAHLLLLGSLGFMTPAWRARGALAVWTSMLSINRFGLEFLVYGFVFGISGVIQFQMRARRAAMQSLELQRQLTTAHLRALQMQLEPHFLFNTLNAITTLVELGRTSAAAEMLSHLNAILKSTLARSTPEMVPLSQELEFIANYLAIEQVRFADRLRVEFHVDPSAIDGMVPCFLLQPIVENAIRHGIGRCEHHGLLEASATREGNRLHMRVRDTGPGSAVQQQGHGIGLKNTRERLHHFYREAYQMQAQALNNGGFEVAISIPYESHPVPG